jgi:hypothetical protein
VLQRCELRIGEAARLQRERGEVQRSDHLRRKQRAQLALGNLGALERVPKQRVVRPVEVLGWSHKARIGRC